MLSETNRRILFFRDLIAANKHFTVNLNLKFTAAFLKEVSSRASIKELRRLSIEQKERSILRKSLEENKF
jgi:hypothetical protein